MMTMSQLVHGTAPTATGDGGESRGGRHTTPGAEQERLDQVPNTGEASDLQRHRYASFMGDVSRESAHAVAWRALERSRRGERKRSLKGKTPTLFSSPVLMRRTASVLFAETRATSCNNAPSRSARDVGGRDTTSRNVPLRWSLLGQW